MPLVRFALICAFALPLCGCLAVAATGAVVGTAVAVTGTAVGVTAKGVGMAAGAVIPDGDDKGEDKKRK